MEDIFYGDESCKKFQNMLGLSTDGAKNMRGHQRGVVGRLTAKNPYLISTIDFCHCYN